MGSVFYVPRLRRVSAGVGVRAEVVALLSGKTVSKCETRDDDDDDDDAVESA